ncbi:MAG: hypothetical protein WDO19_21835 [Bacteroidota bacterium]
MSRMPTFGRLENGWLQNTITSTVRLKVVYGPMQPLFTYHLSTGAATSPYPVTSSGYEQLSITHFDDYTAIPGGLTSSFDAAWASYFSTTYNANPVFAQQQVTGKQTRGLVTWSQTKCLVRQVHPVLSHSLRRPSSAHTNKKHECDRRHGRDDYAI